MMSAVLIIHLYTHIDIYAIKKQKIQFNARTSYMFIQEFPYTASEK